VLIYKFFLIAFIFVLTKNQNFQRINIKKKTRNRASLLKFRPHLRGVVSRLRLATPKKPNSARRPVAHIHIYFNDKNRVSHIPGGGHTVKKHSEVLINGNGVRDLPGINYSCVRGVYDFLGSYTKTKRRSIYGVKLPVEKKQKLRRKFRAY
jgi:small subunit ribosomal protein S12